MTTPRGDAFFDRLRVLDNQARRIETSEEEILVDFRRVDETFGLAHGTPTVTVRADEPETYQVVGGGDADREIIVGEWLIKT